MHVTTPEDYLRVLTQHPGEMIMPPLSILETVQNWPKYGWFTANPVIRNGGDSFELAITEFGMSALRDRSHVQVANLLNLGMLAVEELAKDLRGGKTRYEWLDPTSVFAEEFLRELVMSAGQWMTPRLVDLPYAEGWVWTGWIERQLTARGNASLVEFRITDAGITALRASYKKFADALELEFMNVADIRDCITGKRAE